MKRSVGGGTAHAITRQNRQTAHDRNNELIQFNCFDTNCVRESNAKCDKWMRCDDGHTHTYTSTGNKLNTEKVDRFKWLRASTVKNEAKEEQQQQQKASTVATDGRYIVDNVQKYVLNDDIVSFNRQPRTAHAQTLFAIFRVILFVASSIVCAHVFSILSFSVVLLFSLALLPSFWHRSHSSCVRSIDLHFNWNISLSHDTHTHTHNMRTAFSHARSAHIFDRLCNIVASLLCANVYILFVLFALVSSISLYSVSFIAIKFISFQWWHFSESFVHKKTIDSIAFNWFQEIIEKMSIGRLLGRPCVDHFLVRCQWPKTVFLSTQYSDLHFWLFSVWSLAHGCINHRR